LNKNKEFTINEWIIAVQSWGIPAETISQITKLPIPGNLHDKISSGQEQTVKAEGVPIYDTHDFPETENLYYKDHRML
jgi:alanyl-tRNA synthetase